MSVVDPAFEAAGPSGRIRSQVLGRLKTEK
jgi:hypothetical protein